MKHQNFVEWMKALGMLLIVIGHVFGDPYQIFNSVSQPIYTKQLGVAFFVFITGWSLANETRVGFRVVYNRIFPIYFYGLLSAVLLSTIYFSIGADINESNYLPLIGGINVFFNYFPANPTTWYIGTYIHLILFWFFFLRGRKIGKRHLVIAFLLENIVRSTILALDQNMIAYMFFPNWLTVFLLGGYLYQKRDVVWNPKILLLLVVWILVLALWASPFNSLPFDKSFPFRNLLIDEFWALPVQSLFISIIYVTSTLVVLEIARHLPKVGLVSFFSRNTLIIFIAHMPIMYACSGYIFSLFESATAGRVALVLTLFIGIAVVSELVQKIINIKFLRDGFWSFVQKKRQSYYGKR